MPLLGVSGTALLGISTPLDETNLYSELVASKDPTTGENLFRTIEVVLICPECAAAGLKDVCPHSAVSLLGKKQRKTKSVIPWC